MKCWEAVMLVLLEMENEEISQVVMRRGSYFIVMNEVNR